MNWELVSIITFFSLISLFILKNRKNLEFRYGIVIKRWKKGKEVIERFARKRKRFLRIIGDLAIISFFVSTFISVYYLVNSLIQKESAFGLVFPSVSGVKYPKPLIGVPFWYWIIGIFSVIFPHETSHALLARVEKIKMKDYGIFLFLFFPLGAFVDIDEKKIKKLGLREKLRIYSIGSFSNFLVAGLVIGIYLLSLGLFSFFIQTSGVMFESLAPNSSAEKVNLKGIIKEIDNQTINSVLELDRFLSTKKPGDMITVKTTEGTFTLNLTEHPEIKGRGYIGIIGVKNYYVFKFSQKPVPNFFYNLFSIWIKLISWIGFLNLGVGLANFLPIKPLDGGKITEELFLAKSKKYGKKISNFISFLFLFLLLLTLTTSFS